MRSILFLSLLAGALSAADPIPKSDGTTPAKKKLAFPAVTPSADPPAPAPIPGAVPVLTADVQYVIPSDEPFLLLASPANVVTVTREAGPIKVRGKFLDGTGKVETRTYNAKHIAIIEPATNAKGRVELIAVLVGATEENQAVRMLVDVNQGPQPPPKPDPEPTPPEPVVVKSFRVIFVYESGDTLPASVHSILYGKTVEDFLNANCTGGKSGWARRDKDASGMYDADRQAVWDAVKSEFQPPKNTKVPAVAIQVNDKITIEPFPATPAAMVALLKKYSEGK